MSGKLTIKPFKHQVLMDRKAAEAEWLLLKQSIDKVFECNISNLKFEILYRTAYNIVLHKHGEMLYSEIKKVFECYIDKSFDVIYPSSDDSILKETLVAWEFQRTRIGMVRDIVMYLDRTYTQYQRITPVYDLGLSIFREKVIFNPSIAQRLRRVLLQNIENERNGQLIDISLQRGILLMFLEIGLGGKNIYETEFEIPFLSSTRDFYREESLKFLSTHSSFEYIEKVEARLAQEYNRVGLYLAQSTRPKLKNITENELITNRAKHLVDMEHSGFVSMLRDNQIDQLKALYALFGRVPSNHELLRTKLKSYVKDIGQRIIEDQENLKESSSTFVTKILDLKSKFDNIVLACFNNETRMLKVLKESFEDFMNINNHTAAYLAQYVDELMKGELKNCGLESEADQKLDPVIILFRHVHDKDIFENFYKLHLSKRLLQGKTGPIDIEKSFVIKLKSEHGYQFTSKLEGMFTDIKISDDIMDAYKCTQLYKESSIELSVNTLTAGHWPTSHEVQCTLPQSVTHFCCDSFLSYYLHKHSGRKLQWQLHLGNADVKANFPLGKKELNVSTYQMCILMLFNDCANNSLTLSHIRHMTNIADVYLKRHLLSLCTPKFRILNKSSKAKGISEDDTFTFNDQFTSKLRRIQIPLVLQKDVEVKSSTSVGGGNTCDDPDIEAINSTSVAKIVEEDRKHMVEAVIVRIMKARKQLTHNDLVAEVIRQTAYRFMSDPQFTKKRIESLIERDYLKRDPDDQRVYFYLA